MTPEDIPMPPYGVPFIADTRTPGRLCLVAQLLAWQVVGGGGPVVGLPRVAEPA